MDIQPAGTATFDFTGRVGLVAGGSRGIGADTARALAQAGASVVVGARSYDVLQALATRINDEIGAERVVAVRADVTDPDSGEELVATALERFGRLDIAFNNATDGPMPGPLADIDVAEFDRGIAANVRGTFLGLRAQVPAMVAGGGGSIVNMASVAGITAVGGLGAYVAGKAGIVALTKVAALDYAAQGVRINVVAPGPIRTEHIIAAGEQAQAHAAASVPMQRMGEPGDVSDVVLWLASDRACFVTGAVIPIDGGQSAGTAPRRMYRQGEPMD